VLVVVVLIEPPLCESSKLLISQIGNLAEDPLGITYCLPAGVTIMTPVPVEQHVEPLVGCVSPSSLRSPQLPGRVDKRINVDASGLSIEG
jgi:hypothetical protein